MNLYRCAACGKTYVTRPVYCRCGAQEFRSEPSPGNGQVYSCTTLYSAAEAFEKDLPFQLAIIELEEGVRLTARITGPSVNVGDPVRCVEERDGVYFFSAT